MRTLFYTLSSLICLWLLSGPDSVCAATRINAAPNPSNNVVSESAMKPFLANHTVVASNSESVLLTLTGSIQTGSLAASYCAGSNVTVSFTSTGVSFNPGNVFTAELSDASGSFASPVSIGTLISVNTADNISAVIPSNSPAGAAYRIRVVSSDPAITGTDNGSDFSIFASPLPTPGAITGTVQACLSATPGSTSFSVAPVAGATGYTWTLPSGFTIISGQGTTTLWVQWTASAIHAGINGSLCVVATGPCLPSAPSCEWISYQVAAPVTPGSVSGLGRLCPYDTTSYTLVPVPRAMSYNWTVPPASGLTILSGQGTNTISIAVGPTYIGDTLRVTASNACGTSAIRIKVLRQRGTWFADYDGDGYGDLLHDTLACVQPPGFVSDSTDCNDSIASVNPGAAELCNAIDDDCDLLTDDADPSISGQPVWYSDVDGDTYGNNLSSVLACIQPVGYVSDNTDCNDGSAAVNPGAIEICNGIDDDCDGLTDDADPSITGQATWYADTDGDTYGNAMSSVLACTQPLGYVSDNTDCNDGSAAVNPGATEICNGIDDDCDGLTDDADPSITGQATWYADTDGDTFGDASVTAIACTQPLGYVSNNTDCNDGNAAINPGATEVCNSVDDDCDLLTDDADPSITGQPTWYADADADTYGNAMSSVPACTQPVGYVSDNTDCNDGSGAVNPGATEVCNGIDDDCDGLTDDADPSVTGQSTWYADTDGDTYGNAMSSILACTQPLGYVSDNTDCNDGSAAVNPGATEICNGTDDDCDGLTDDADPSITGQATWYADADGDIYGNAMVSVVSCNQPLGYVLDNTDCNDGSAAVNPGATEICNGIDDDCDGLTDDADPSITGQPVWYADADGDTYGNPVVTTLACVQPPGYVSNNTDCNDGNAAVNPAATEVCNGIDDDCNGLTDDNIPPLPPTGPISGISLACYPAIAGSGTFSIGPVAGATGYSWTVPSGFTIASGQGTTSIVVTWTNTSIHNGIVGPLCVTPSSLCATGTTSCINIGYQIAIPVTPGSISGPAKVCPGDIATYSISLIARAMSYTWTVPAGMTITSGQGTNVINVTVNPGYVGGTLGVTASNPCGTSPMRVKGMGLNLPLTPGTIVGQKYGICNTSGLVYSVPPVVGATSYVWTVSSGISIVSGQGTDMLTVNVGLLTGTGTITVMAVNNCGNSPVRSTSVYGVPDRPQPITGSTSVCTNSIMPYSVPTVAGTSLYTWTVSGAASIASGQGTKNITVQWGGAPVSSQTLTVIASNACGNSASRTLSGINVTGCPRIGEDEKDIAALIVYPNPASDFIHVEFMSDQLSDYNLKIADVSGRLIYSENGQTVEGLNQHIIPTTGLESGIYMVMLEQAGKLSVIRMAVE